MDQTSNDLSKSGRADLSKSGSASLKLGSEEREEDFYRDLDKKISHKSCCTCQTLAILFVILLFIFSGFISFIYWQVTRSGLSSNFSNYSRVADFEDEMISNTSGKSGQSGQYDIAITADNLNSLMNDGLSMQDFVLKDATASINPSDMMVYGNLVQPFSSRIILTLTPKASDGKLVFTVTKITAGSITLPKVFNTKIEKSLNGLFDAKMSNFYKKANVIEAKLGENKIIVTVGPKT